MVGMQMLGRIQERLFLEGTRLFFILSLFSAEICTNFSVKFIFCVCQSKNRLSVVIYVIDLASGSYIYYVLKGKVHIFYRPNILKRPHNFAKFPP